MLPRPMVLSTIVALLVPAVTPAAALAADSPPGRVSYLDGRLSVSSEADVDTWITVNAPVFVGDELATAPGSFAEIELAGGVFVRMAGASVVVFDEIDEQDVVVLVEGALAVQLAEHAPPLILVTDELDARALPGSRVRLRADARYGVAELAVVAGRVELRDGYARLERGESLMQTPDGRVITDERLVSDAFSRFDDERARWIEERVAEEQAQYLGWHELEGHGQWLYVGGRRSWRPHVQTDWRPYMQGSWSWAYPHGWVWVPGASWEYVTHHYGRWVLDTRYGWVWVPVPGWSPAWVAWAVVGPNVGWAPLGLDGVVLWASPGHGSCDAAVWLFAAASYLYWGGGCCGPQVVYVVEQTFIDSHDVVIVDDPHEDLAPDGATARDDGAGEPRWRRGLLDRLVAGGRRPDVVAVPDADKPRANAPRRVLRDAHAGAATKRMGDVRGSPPVRAERQLDVRTSPPARRSPRQSSTATRPRAAASPGHPSPPQVRQPPPRRPLPKVAPAPRKAAPGRTVGPAATHRGLPAPPPRQPAARRHEQSAAKPPAQATQPPVVSKPKPPSRRSAPPPRPRNAGRERQAKSR